MCHSTDSRSHRDRKHTLLHCYIYSVNLFPKAATLWEKRKSLDLLSHVHTQTTELITPLWSRVINFISKTRQLLAHRNCLQVNSANCHPSSHKELNPSLSKGAHLLVTLPHLRDHTGCSDADDRPSALWHHCHQWKSLTFSTGVCDIDILFFVLVYVPEEDCTNVLGAIFPTGPLKNKNE